MRLRPQTHPYLYCISISINPQILYRNAKQFHALIIEIYLWFINTRENFYNMEFYCQHYKENQRVGGHTYELPITMLDRVEVCLNEAIDEFYLKLVKPVTVETYDGMARQEDVLHVEVVKEEIAVENDMDFIGHEKYNQLINDGEYCVGRTNSYYKELGTVNGNTYYYREL